MKFSLNKLFAYIYVSFIFIVLINQRQKFRRIEFHSLECCAQVAGHPTQTRQSASMAPIVSAGDDLVVLGPSGLEIVRRQPSEITGRFLGSDILQE